MTIGRRRVFLALSFLCLALVLTGGLAHAQDPAKTNKSFRLSPVGRIPPHPVWGGSLTPEQLKQALARLGQGDGDPEMGEFQEMLKNSLMKQNPNWDPNDPKLKQAIESIVGNKELMDQLKAMANQKQGAPGVPGKFSQDDLAKMLKSKLPDGLNLPNIQPPNTQTQDLPQPNNPNLPNPLANPKQGGNRNDPTGSNGQGNLMPKWPGQPEFPNPNNPENPPNIGKGNPLAPENNPFGQPDEPTDPRSKSMAAMAALWERNIGPLDETPEVKRTLFDLMSGENGLDFDVKDDKGNSIWDLLKNSSGDNSGLADALNGDGGDWKMPKFDLPTLGWGKWFGNSSSSSNADSSASSFKPPPEPSSGSGFGGVGSFGGSWLPVVLLGLAILGGLLLWWWYLQSPSAEAGSHVGNGLGPWPVDPRAINTREDVVKAFEYLSVFICGPAAKMWTHGTIAEALNDLAISHGETAVKLARLYEVARYAPLDEPLTRNELIEARHIICDLAGVS
jgi:hypothetical protein